MPVSAYFNGSGSKVMSNMQREYGPKTGKSVFYATANKQGMTPMKPKSLRLKSGVRLASPSKLTKRV